MALFICISEIKHVINRSLQFGAFIVDNCSKEDGYWVCVEVKEMENVKNLLTRDTT